MGARRSERKRKRDRAEPTKESTFTCVIGELRVQTIASVFVLMLLPTLLLWSVTFGGKSLAPLDLLLVMSPWRHFAQKLFPDFHAVKAPLLDVVQQYYPWRKFYAETLSQGELPLWNPFMFCGTSFVGNGMSAIFYPLNLLFVMMPIETAFGWVAWLHLVLAGIFMFGFLRQFVSPLAALTGSIVFQLCGFFIAWLAYLPLLCTAIWLPAALWAYEASSRSPSHFTLCLIASSSIGMALLAGHPQIGFYILWAFGVYVLLRTVAEFRTGTARWLWTLGCGVSALLFGVAFGAPQLLPLLEMAQISFRSEPAGQTVIHADKFPIDQFVRLFIPSFFGDWRSGTHFVWDFARFNFVERTGYAGVVAFLLAFIGLASWRRIERKQRALLTAGLIFAVFGLSAASIPIVHRFMAIGLPGTQSFVGISRALFLFDLGIAILCAIGVEALRRSQTPSLQLWRFHALVLAVPLLFMAVCVSLGINAHAETAFHPLLRDFTLHQIQRWLMLSAIGTFAISFALRTNATSHSRIPRFLTHFALYSLPIIVATDMLSFAWGQNPEADRKMAFFETPSIRWLKRNLGTQRFVAVGTDAIKHWTPSNTLMVYGLRDAQGSDSLMTMRIFRFLQAWDKNSPLHRAFAVRNFNSPLMDLMAVRYVVAAEPLSAKEQKGLKFAHEGDLWVYENDDALPRVFAVSRWQWVKSPQSALAKVKAPNFDPHEVAILEGTGKPEAETKGVSDQLVQPSEFRDEINRLKIAIELNRPSTLVVADGLYPGWRAFGRSKRDDEWQPLSVFASNYAFRAVLLSPGKWQVIWVYFPSVVIVGLFLNLVAVSVMVASVTGKFLHRIRPR